MHAHAANKKDKQKITIRIILPNQSLSTQGKHALFFFSFTIFSEGQIPEVSPAAEWHIRKLIFSFKYFPAICVDLLSTPLSVLPDAIPGKSR